MDLTEERLNQQITYLLRQIAEVQKELEALRASQAEEPVVLSALRRHTEFDLSHYRDTSGSYRKLYLCSTADNLAAGVSLGALEAMTQEGLLKLCSASSLTVGKPSEKAIRQLARTLNALEDEVR